jgi:steroid 5-alpha reductase family enzyme
VSNWMIVAVTSGVTSVVFLLAWVLARRIGNYSIVDAIWAYGIGGVAAAWLLVFGDASPKVFVAVFLVLVWSMRLGWHLHQRIAKSHPEEDPRYVKLRELWKGREVSAFFLFFQMQAVSVILLALPFLFIAVDPSRSWSAWELAGLLVAGGGIAGEAVADLQMTRFKKTHPGSGAVCREGLWRFSRHPNYFFESLIWAGFYLYACGSEWGWTSIHAPAVILFLLLRVTGIPPSEAAALRRKGDAYRDYQKTTSSFIPWPPKPN